MVDYEYNDSVDESPDLIADFLEFKTSEIEVKTKLNGDLHGQVIERYVNLKRTEISEVLQVVDDNGKLVEDKCEIVMKNGRKYTVLESYAKVMTLVWHTHLTYDSEYETI